MGICLLRVYRISVLLFTIQMLVLLGQRPAGAIRVEVTDVSGAAIEAPGLIESLSSGLRRNFRTDAQGSATVAGLPFGQYHLRIWKDGFAAYSSVIKLDSPAPVTHPVTLAIGVATYTVAVTGGTPIAGLDHPVDELPAPTQTATQLDIDASGALDVSGFLNRRMNNVFLNEMQGNPLQPDLNYRGFTASPLLGTPQGVSVYMDGVRLNQPFGDVVSWDLIPRIAISEVSLIPGSNPLFGLNTLGGSISMKTRDGLSNQGTALSLSGGSFGRMSADFEHGGVEPRGLDWFLAGSLFFEDGWRESSPSAVRQFFGRLGWQRDRTAISLTAAYANNGLTGNGLQEQSLLASDYASIYTKPDSTANRSPFLTVNLRHNPSSSVTLAGNAYYRYIRTRTLNGDINLDDDSEYDGLLSRTAAQQRNYGASGQASWLARVGAHRNQFTVGGGFDGNSVGFTQSSELGYLNPDRSVTGAYVFGDAVDLFSRLHSGSVYATDTLSLADRFHLTLSGRFNRTVIDNQDRLNPIEGPGSLTGRHTFNRFNPGVGGVYRIAGGVSLYAGYTEGSRAPTSIELGCADPETPCRLPNAMAGDPPLQQVVTRTFEAGLRGRTESSLQWNVGWFRAANRDDILFVASEQTGFGYFKNFGQTLREGVEIGLGKRFGRVSLGGGYTFLAATFQSEELVNGASNSSGDDGIIEIEPGDRIPLIPRHTFKAYADIQATSRLSVMFGVVAAGSSYARGNENNQHTPDGDDYLGEGTSPGYAVANAGVRYQAHPRVQLFGQVNNLFDQRYYTGAQLGPTGFTAEGAVFKQSTFFAPGAPRGVWGGIRIRF